jgi:hypothetical protein
MKPRIDLTDKGSHAIWESGRWNQEQALGRSTLIAGPDGEKLSVVFDSDPKKTNFHYLFFANPQQVVANAFVRAQRVEGYTLPGAFSSYKYDLELLRIDTLTNEIVQGASVPRATYSTLWTLRQFGSADFEEMVDRSYNDSRIGYKRVYRDLVLEAIRKALTPAEDQRLFWGIPRNTSRT